MSHSRISCVPAPISQSLASRRRRPAGQSLVQPLPPRTCTVSRASSVAHLEAQQMTPEQSTLERTPLSTLRETEQRQALLDCSLTIISASLPWMSWNSPIFLPNCSRVCEQGRARSRQLCMIPTGPAASTSRSQSSPDISTYTPLFTSPSTFSSGTTQSSNISSQVSEPRIPSLSSFCAVLNPLNPFSTRNAVIFSPVFAYTTSTSAVGPFVHHILFPFSTQPPAVFVAFVFIETTSEPAFGSLIESAPTNYPLHSLGRYFLRCAQFPWRQTWPMQRAVSAPQLSPIEPEAREISSMMRLCAVYFSSTSSPPYWLGTVTPRKPIFPNSFQSSSGNLLSRSVFAAKGATLALQKSRAAFRYSSSSGDRLHIWWQSIFVLKSLPNLNIIIQSVQFYYKTKCIKVSRRHIAQQTGEQLRSNLIPARSLKVACYGYLLIVKSQLINFKQGRRQSNRANDIIGGNFNKDNIMIVVAALLAAVRADVAWPFTSCGSGPYVVSAVTLTANPSRNKNDTIKMTGTAKTTMTLRNVDLEVRLNGVHLDTENITYTDSYDAGDKSQFSYVNFVPSFAPVGTYSLDFNFKEKGGSSVGCVQIQFRL